MFLLCSLFFFLSLSVSASDGVKSGTEVFPTAILDPLSKRVAQSVEIWPGRSYRVIFGGGDLVYSAQEYPYGFPHCSLVCMINNGLVIQPLGADWFEPIVLNAWRSYIRYTIDAKKCGQIRNINGNPEDFAIDIGKGCELQAVKYGNGTLGCHVWEGDHRYLYVGGEAMYSNIEVLRRKQSDDDEGIIEEDQGFSVSKSKE